MPSWLVDLVLHLGHLLPRLPVFRMDVLHLALLLETHGRILHPPPIADRHDQRLDILRDGQMARMQAHRRIHKRHPLTLEFNHVALQPGSNRVLSTPAKSNHADFPASGRRAPQRLQEIHADLVRRRLLVPRHPHDERQRAGEDARVLRQRGLLGLIDRNQQVGDLERDGIALEEVREVDEPFAAFGVGVGDDLVVGQRQAEDVRVHHYDALRVGAVADHVGVEAVNPFFLAQGLTFVDGALRNNAVSGCGLGLDRGRTLIHSSHAIVTNNALLCDVLSPKKYI